MKAYLNIAGLLFPVIFGGLAAFAAPVRIAVITDLSGQMSSWGRQTQLGAEMARDELNGQGGDLSVIFGDHQLQAKDAVREVRKLLEVDKADAVFIDFSGPAVATAPIARDAGMLFVYSGGAMSALSANPSAFKSFINFKSGCRRVVESWKARGFKRIAILKPSTEFGELCLLGARESEHDIIEQEFNPGEEVATQVLAIKTREVQAILNPAHIPDYIRMLRALQTYKYIPLLARQEDDITQAARDEFPELMRGTTFFGLKAPSPEFTEKVRRRQGESRDFSPITAALSYLHIRQMYKAISKCPRRDLDCQTNTLAASPAEPALSFLGWRERVASFEIALKNP